MNLFRTPWLHQPLLSRSRYGQGAGVGADYRDRVRNRRSPRPAHRTDDQTAQAVVGGFRPSRT